MIVEEEEDIAKFADVTSEQLSDASSKPPPTGSSPPSATSQASVPVASVTSSSATGALPTSSAAANPPSRVIASPLAKKLASEQGIDLNAISQIGSGPRGRIVAGDLQNMPKHASSTTATYPDQASSIADGASFTDIPLSNMRTTIAKRLTLSKQTIPRYYLSSDVDMRAAVQLRKQLNESGDIKLSVNDLVIKAASLACRKVPECNSSWQDTFIRQYTHVDMCVAVATDNGLITPIVKQADLRGLGSINQEVLNLAEKARANKLQPHEFQGGTFTISNLGMFGVRSFSAIINPPQACILAVGAAERRLVVDTEAESGYSVAPVMCATLCCDHRVVDGAVGARWLQQFKMLLEQPMRMLM